MKIITISREHGAGGRVVGLELAKMLGVELFDRDIVRELAKESKLDYEFLSDESETLHKAESFWSKITPIQYDQKDALYEMQKEVVLDFAKKGAQVIVGRCSDAILEDAGYDVFNVFLYGSEKIRVLHVNEKVDSNDINAVHRFMKKIDAERKAFYNKYTGRQWGDYKNYNLLIDTSVVGIETAAKIIYDAYNSSLK